MNIRDIAPADYAACREIYNHYIRSTTVTLEFDPLSPERYAARIERVRAEYPFLVCEDGGLLAGFAYLDRFNERAGYRYACDLSIYLCPERRGGGLGRALYAALERRARAMGLRDVISIVTDENEASLRFHAAMGFRECARFPGIAEKFGRRLGAVYLRKSLE